MAREIGLPEIGLFEAIYSQRAIRQFKPDPVPDELVHKLIEAGTKAPSGGNRQPWKFLVIRDAELKRRIGEYYHRAYEAAYGGSDTGTGTLQPAIRRSATSLAETMHQVPLLILACIEHDGSAPATGRGGSIFPAVQNILPAARGLGLGSVLTSLHRRYEAEIKELLGIPENVETVALLPIGYPAPGSRYGPTTRQPVAEVAYRDRWGAAL